MKFLATIAAALLAVSEPYSPPTAHADQTNAFCSVGPHDHSLEFKQGPCTFRQYQGTIHVTLDGVTHTFLSTEQDKSYTRINRDEGIWLNREGDVTVVVMWEKPAL